MHESALCTLKNEHVHVHACLWVEERRGAHGVVEKLGREGPARQEPHRGLGARRSAERASARAQVRVRAARKHTEQSDFKRFLRRKEQSGGCIKPQEVKNWMVR